MNRHPMDVFLERYPPTPDVIRENDLTGRGVHPDERLAPRRLPIERTIDLHGLTLEEAQLQLDRFLLSAQAEGILKVLIVHGKGNHSESMSVLKRFVRDFLEKNPNVGATGTPPIREGGSGATWAVIRQRSR